MVVASNAVIEFFREDDIEYSVRFAFNDKYYDVCNGDWYNKTEYKCKLKPFINILSKSNYDMSKYCT